MEAVMVVTAHDDRGMDLLAEAIKEAPYTGENAIYQRIARAEEVYDQRDDYTFLTLAGIVAIMGYSGSLLIVLTGAAVVTGLILTIEGVLWRFNPNPFLASVAGMGMAIELTQSTFPYLTAVFFLLLSLSLVFLSLLGRIAVRTGSSARRSPITQS